MGAAHSKEGDDFILNKNSVYVKDLDMGNQSKKGFKFVSVPATNHVKNEAYVYLVLK